jgi:hypothetical protein
MFNIYLFIAAAYGNAVTTVDMLGGTPPPRACCVDSFPSLSHSPACNRFTKGAAAALASSTVLARFRAIPIPS